MEFPAATPDAVSVRSVSRRRRDDPVDALYDVPLSEFVAARNRLATRLRDEGRADQAKAIRALAKPKAVVWAINRVARRSPKLVERVVAAFDTVKAAQLRRPSELVERNTALRTAIDAVVHDGIEALSDVGITTTLDTHRRIASTLRGAAAGERAALREGRLRGEVTPAGFEVFDLRVT